jgi:hypothetical protein
MWSQYGLLASLMLMGDGFSIPSEQWIVQLSFQARSSSHQFSTGPLQHQTCRVGFRTGIMLLMAS